MNSFEDSILRVLKGDSVVGAAFLVSDRLVATCAHVIESAGSKVGGKISLQLSNGKRIEAIVDTDFWRDTNAEDISILRLNKSLENIQPVILGSSSGTKGHNFSTFGFPKQGQELTGGGEIIGQAIINGIKVLQLRSPEVTPGFSGAPIFDETTKRVVGMIVAITPPDEYQRLGTTAFAIPSETIREICPELQISDVCPYRSLDVFNEEDSPFFFGRERVVQKMVDSLKREPRFLAVLGPSGSGKSSIVRAGLIPALKQGKLFGSDQWNMISIRPTSHPFEQLNSAGLSGLDNGLENALRNWKEDGSEKQRILLFVDQFEEVLTSTSQDIRRRFILELAHVLKSTIEITVVLTLRDDFYSLFQEEAEILVNWLERGLVNIPTTVNQNELLSMIVEPAQKAGLVFEDGLADIIALDASESHYINNLAHSTILPLLQFALTQLWEKRHDGRLTHEAYHALGGVTGGLTQWADRTYYSLDSSDQLIAQQILTELVYLGDASQNLPDSRRTLLLDDLLFVNRQQTDLSRIVSILANARLVITGRNHQGKYVEFIHDAIIQQWGLLKYWLIENRQFLSWRQKLQINYRDWKAGKADVLRGLALDEAEKWLMDYGNKLNENEKNYINASVLARARHEKALKRAELLSLIPYMFTVFVVGIIGIYVITRLVGGRLEERLSNQLLESGRVVSDLIVQREVKHIETARAVAFTRGVGDAVRDGNVEQIALLAKSAAGWVSIDSVMIFDREGIEKFHAIKEFDGTLTDNTKPTRVSSIAIVEDLLAENNADSPPKRVLAIDPADGRYYYFTALPVVSGNDVVGVIVVGTSVNTIMPVLKNTSLADVVIYDATGQAIATTLVSQGTDSGLFLRTISIPKETYTQVIAQDESVEGENLSVDERWFKVARGPLKIADDRVAVYAVVLPLDFVVESSSTFRGSFTILIFVLIVGLILISLSISRLIFKSLSSSLR